jgi:hypothetical protein
MPDTYPFWMGSKPFHPASLLHWPHHAHQKHAITRVLDRGVWRRKPTLQTRMLARSQKLISTAGSFINTLSPCSQSLPALIYVMGVVKHFSFVSSRLRAARSLPLLSLPGSQCFDRSGAQISSVHSASPRVVELPTRELLLTSKSLPAITYATVCNCSFQTTLSPTPATLTRYPLPNSLPAFTYEYRGGGGVAPRVRNSLKTKKGVFCNMRILPSNAPTGFLAFHESQVTSRESPVTFPKSLVTHHSSDGTSHNSLVTIPQPLVTRHSSLGVEK